MNKVLRVCLCAALTLSLTACLATPPAAVTAAGSGAAVQTGAALRPEATGRISGKLVLPYRVQLSQRVAHGGFDVLGFVTGLPAHAQEAESVSDSAPLTEADLSELNATVDGQPVEIEVTEVVSPAGEDSTEITYTIDEAPVGDGLEVVEITTGDGAPLGGAVVDAEADSDTEQDITPESTALLETCVDVHGSVKIAELTEADLALLQQLPALLNKLASIRSILRKDGTLKPHKMRHFKAKGRGAALPPALSASPEPVTESADPHPETSASPSASPSPDAAKICICPHPRHTPDDDHEDDDDQDEGDDDDDNNSRKQGKGGKGSPRGRK